MKNKKVMNPLYYKYGTSVRASNGLDKLGITGIGELKEVLDKGRRVLFINGIGCKTLNELKDLVKAHYRGEPPRKATKHETLERMVNSIHSDNTKGYATHVLCTTLLEGVTQLTSIAESLAKIANPMVVSQELPQCKNCGAHKAPDVKWFSPGFCSKLCVMEMALKLTNEDKGE